MEHLSHEGIEITHWFYKHTRIIYYRGLSTNGVWPNLITTLWAFGRSHLKRSGFSISTWRCRLMKEYSSYTKPNPNPFNTNFWDQQWWLAKDSLCMVTFPIANIPKHNVLAGLLEEGDGPIVRLRMYAEPQTLENYDHEATTSPAGKGNSDIKRKKPLSAERSYSSLAKRLPSHNPRVARRWFRSDLLRWAS